MVLQCEICKEKVNEKQQEQHFVKAHKELWDRLVAEKKIADKELAVLINAHSGLEFRGFAMEFNIPLPFNRWEPSNGEQLEAAKGLRINIALDNGVNSTQHIWTTTEEWQERCKRDGIKETDWTITETRQMTPAQVAEAIAKATKAAAKPKPVVVVASKPANAEQEKPTSILPSGRNRIFGHCSTCGKQIDITKDATRSLCKACAAK